MTAVNETVAGLPVVQAQKSEEKMYEHFCSLTDQNGSLFYHATILIPWIALYLEEMVALFILAAFISAFYLKDIVGVSAIAVALTNCMSLLSKVQMTCRQSAEVENHFTAVERLAQLVNTVPQEEAGWVPSAPEESWPAHGCVFFQNVTIRYRPGLPAILEDLSFSISAGKSVGLIGPSGCGKSSCLRAFLRLVDPEQGKILIDDVDICRVPLKVLRERISVVPQEPLVFVGTLRCNLMPDGVKRVAAMEDDASCWAMLQVLGMKTMIQNWPQGLDTELTAGGESLLSLGQRQLISLGRALLRTSQILCVDEATANVDGATDAALQRALHVRTQNQHQRTQIIIAHRLWTLRHCHEVLLLQPGPPSSVKRISNPEGTQELVLSEYDES
eukprot:gnl/MRDRNA2_/MRDRNA2_276049_c0_seq1.p1 gnl/MRDRNA2_/MRDRNA2_276049_c0~~gnl/MRDRNA2_/MRDRNA2_276049_c0_seq1.p1  ORF type:complete len:404 (+),score=60.52 gnl/MRDRNA2_/MRDRNA2_276049_c0_seq1:51-1214(+)